MAAGLFYVYTEPGSVDEAEFHDWYDHEHGPARLKVPGFGGAYRYLALDDQKPPWLALYELDGPAPDFLSVHELAGPEVLEDPRYRAAISTPWRDRVVASALRRERRVFGLRNTIGA
jgi:hypothetical protein